MPCPSCSKEVEFLWCSATEHATYAYNGEEFELKECVADEMDFRCPHCGAVVARNTDEAKAILKGKPAEGVDWERLRRVQTRAETSIDCFKQILYRMDIATMEICFYVANTNTKDRRKRRLLDEIGRHAEAMRKAVEELARIVHEEERRRKEASALAELVHEEERRRREASRATEA
jgi:phage FluMu protein Com